MIWEILISAYNSIIANKIRSFLTITGIVIGIAAVIAISGLGEGSKKSVNDNLKKLGTNRITIGTNYRSGIVERDKLTYDDEEFLRSYEEIVNISPLASMSGRYEFGSGDYYEVTLKGGNEEVAKIENVDMLQGEFISKEDLKSAAKVVIIDDTFAKMVYNTADAVGKTLKLKLGAGYKEFTVKGIYKNTSSNDSMFSKNFRETAFTSISIIDQMSPNFSISQYEATIKDMAKLETVSANITKLLEIKHHNYNKYNVESALKRMESINSVLDTLTIFVSFVAGISLFVGGIGVMNIMLVSVTERTKEIGICKSIGASNSVIMMQFIIEAVILCTAGGLLGIAAGYGAGHIIGNIVKLTPVISLKAVAAAFVISTAIGLVFGVYPAKKAARLNPIDALRYE